jgi:glycerol kinase
MQDRGGTMDKKYIMAIDQGTTGTRVIFFNHDGRVCSTAYREIRQIYPNPGWVEHDPAEYWDTTMECSKEAMTKGGIDASEIAAIGITCQRETTILWEKDTGKPVYNAIVWQSRQTAGLCEELKAAGYEPAVKNKTGLLIDAYFSGTKIKWIIENVPGVKEKIAKGNIYMGNIDSWLIWNLSGGASHVTDYTNASRSMLLNIHTLEWDEELMGAMGVSMEILPDLKPSSGVMAYTGKTVFFGQEIPIAGDAGDQHAATFGQTCYEAGMAKNTYGTALALMMNTGEKPVMSKNGLTTDLLWHVAGKTNYSLEGVVFIGGATVQWLRDGLQIIKSAQECDVLAESVPNTGGVYLVPAFTGMCAPYWDMYARGTLIGITGGTKKEHIARSALEAIAYETRDVLEAMIADSGVRVKSLRVDGGATKSDFLMQFQADILGIPVEKPLVTEMAALGAAYLAGLGVGFWESKSELSRHMKIDRFYEPKMSADKREELYKGWKKAVQRSLNWAEK